jgi:hypothetical protein
MTDRVTVTKVDDEATLSGSEVRDLAECEAVLREDLDGFIRVGRALQRIRDDRLYRDAYSTFEEYCRGEWGLSRTYAFGHIEAAKVVDNLQTFGIAEHPHNQRVAQELVPLRNNPQLMVEVWQEVLQEAQANGRKPSAVAVQRAVRQHTRSEITPPTARLLASLRELVGWTAMRAHGFARIGVDDLLGLSDIDVSEYNRAASRAKSGLKKLGDLQDWIEAADKTGK